MTAWYRKIFPDGTFRKPSVLLIIFSICFAFWYLDLWKPYNTAKGQNSFVWDVMNYYSYLPAVFLNDGSFDFHHGSNSLYLPIGPLGGFVPKTTYGMSILYSPYFALGYKIAYNEKTDLDGFSEPFATCLHWGSIFYVIFGMMFLRKFLLRYFNEVVVAVTLMASLFGTMLFLYTYSFGELAHGHLFFLFSLFLYMIPKWHEQQKYLYTIVIGLVLGLVSLIRPTEIYIFVFFLFWNVRDGAGFKTKVRLLARNYIHLLIIFIIGLLLWIPQFIFWKAHTGNYFYFSYPGEGFFWNDPQIMNILFSYRKGWITYTPLVVLAFVGFFFVKKDFPLSKWTFILITMFTIYLLSCWWDWFFGGCFGSRGFCQNIAWLSIPFAFFIDFVFYSPKKHFLKDLLSLVTLVIIFSCMFHNMGQSYHYINHRLHHDGMTRKVFWDIFRQYQFQDDYQHKYWGYLDFPDYDKMRSGENRDL